MKDKENVEITPGIPVDRDVISQRYFGPKVKNGPKVFKGGRKFVIFAHLPNRVYMPYVAIREKEAEEAEYQRLVASGSGNGNGIINPSSSSKGVGKGKGKGKGKRSVSVTSADNEEWVVSDINSRLDVRLSSLTVIIVDQWCHYYFQLQHGDHHIH